MDDGMSGEKSVVVRSGQFQVGHDPRRGRGPAPGAPNAGAPSASFRADCAAALGRAGAVRFAEDVIAGRVPLASITDRLNAMKFLASYGEGPPLQGGLPAQDLKIVIVDES